MPDLNPSDFAPRGGLLQLGCKDLLDVIKKAEGADVWRDYQASLEQAREVQKAMLQVPKEILGEMAQTIQEEFEKAKAEGDLGLRAVTMPGVIEMGEEITIQELARRTRIKVFRIFAILIQMKIFMANADKQISFDVVEELGRRLGFEVKSVG